MSQVSGPGGKFQTAKNNGFSSRKSGKRLKMKFKEDKQCKNTKKCDSTISFHVHFKAQIDSLSDTVNQLQAKLDRFDQDLLSGAKASPFPGEEAKSLKYLSDGFDVFSSFQEEEAKKELKRVSAELVKLTMKVDAIGKAIDDICEYSYRFNVKVVGLPEVNARESAQQTSSLCVSLFRALGADVSTQDIDTAHRVPTRQASDGPKTRYFHQWSWVCWLLEDIWEGARTGNTIIKTQLRCCRTCPPVYQNYFG